MYVIVYHWCNEHN